MTFFGPVLAVLSTFLISGSFAFQPITFLWTPDKLVVSCSLSRVAVLKFAASDSAFVPDDYSSEEGSDKGILDKVEKLAGKSKRGKKKDDESVGASRKAAASLKPEEIFYEGPPAITETILPTISILTVVGIIPAAAAWARQAWVRYKITSRRIRVQSGLGGKDMVEIVYPDIVELRTVKRLFGDGDMVAFLRDGAKLEVRNIPNFEATIEFILQQLSPDVAQQYREKGDVTK